MTTPEISSGTTFFAVEIARAEAERVRRQASADYHRIVAMTEEACSGYIEADPTIEPLVAALLVAVEALAERNYQDIVAPSQQQLLAVLNATDKGATQ